MTATDHTRGIDLPVRHRRIAAVLALGLVASLMPAAASARTSMPAGGTHIDLGDDGRLTVLMLGSDWRPAPAFGDRLDVIVVVSLDPTTGKFAVVSIPRDTIRIPRHPDNGGGTSGNLRVNYMYDTLYKVSGCAMKCALGKFTKDISRTLGAEIDYFAYVRFTGFDALIDQLGGVEMDIPKELRDRSYNDDPSGPSPYGVYFPVGADVLLGGASTPRCPDYKKAHPCSRALPYVRSRKGTVGSGANSDWNRSSRQQLFVRAAVRTVAAMDQNAPEFEALRLAVEDPDVNLGITTDLPTSLDAALELYGWIQDAGFAGRIILKPPSWAFWESGMPAYTFQLRNGKVRDWVDEHMPAVP